MLKFPNFLTWNGTLANYRRGVQRASSGPYRGTDLEMGYGDVRPWRPPFPASPVVRKGPISSKRVSSQDPLSRKFGNFQLTSPQIWKFSAQPPFSEANVSSQAPHFGNPGRTPLPEKSWVPPPRAYIPIPLSRTVPPGLSPWGISLTFFL